MPILTDIIIIFGLSIVVFLLFHRFRMPTIVGFLLTGVLAGPHGLGLVKAVHEVDLLAEIGVVLLLFAIGLEFSLKHLWQVKKAVLLGGSLQVLLTILVFFAGSMKAGQGPGRSLFIGFLLSLSSTAIVLKLLQDSAEIDSPHGRTTLAILIFQDIIVIPMMLFTPLLAGVAGGAAGAAVPAALKGIGIVVFVVGGAKWLVPKALYQVARTRYREVFLLSIIVIGFGVAWLTNAAGLSLALGAFLAGLIISESEYSHQALASVLPFRDAFTSFFFVSIGMLLDVRVLVHRPLLIAGIAVAVLLAKSVIGCFAVLHLGLPLRNSILVGLALSQVGEFSFILSRTGMEHGLLSKDGYQIFLSVSILTMAAAPFVIGLSGRVADTVIRLPVWGRADPAGGRRRLTLGDVFSRLPLPGKRLRMSLSSAREVEIKDHLIVVGFGFNGRSLARAARIAKIPYVVVETNPETVLSESEKGEPIVYGDATQEAVLEHLKIRQARILVVAISDPAATRRITAVARRLHPDLSIIVRTRYVEEMKPLYELGANEVVPEEYETSVEIFSRVLKKYLLSQDEIEQFISGLRSDGYQMLRRLFKEETDAERFELQLPGFEISVFRIGENSPLVGKSLATGDLRKKRGVNLLAIRRDGEVIPNPGGDAVLRAGDMLVLLGKPEQLAEVAGLF